jgi:hypothetical protein
MGWTSTSDGENNNHGQNFGGEILKSGYAVDEGFSEAKTDIYGCLVERLLG